MARCAGRSPFPRGGFAHASLSTRPEVLSAEADDAREPCPPAPTVTPGSSPPNRCLAKSASRSGISSPAMIASVMRRPGGAQRVRSSRTQLYIALLQQLLDSIVHSVLRLHQFGIG